MTLLQLASIGFIPGALALGGAFLNRLPQSENLDLRFVERLALSFLLGGCLLFPLLFAAAWFGVFYPAVNGGIGWILFLALFKYSFREYNAPSFGQVILLLMSIGLFAWNAHFSTESIFSGRDQGVYSNLGAHIAQEHWLFDDPSYHDLFEQRYFPLTSGGLQGGGYFFKRSEGTVYLQFPPTTAIYMAQGFGVAGYPGLFGFNALIGSLSLLLFYSLARRALGDSRPTLLAAGFFALNAAQIWNLRITLSEPLAQALLVGGLLAMLIGVKRSNHTFLLLGAILASANAFVRIDGLLAATGISAAFAFLNLFGNRNQTSGPSYIAIAFASVATALLAALFGFLTSPGYYDDFTVKIIAMILVAALLATVGVIPLGQNIREPILKFLGSKPLILSLVGLVSIAAIYAYFIRPHIEPFAEFPAGRRLTGRDFRELTLVHLSAYLSLPVIVLAIAGFCMALKRIAADRNPTWAILAFVWATFALLYIYAPQISPDHPWRIRRYTPIIIPGFCLFAALPLNILFRKFLSSAPISITTFLGLAFFLGLTQQTWKPIAFEKFHAGAASFFDSIAENVPPDALIVTDLDRPIFGPLYLAEGKQVVRGKPDNPEHAALVDEIVRKEIAAGRQLVFATSTPLSHAPTGRSRGFSFTDRNIVGVNHPPATEVSERDISVYLTSVNDRLLGYALEDKQLLIGAHPILGVTESGLHSQEKSGESFFRWTSGNTRFSFPWIFPRPPISLSFIARSAGPNGTPTSIAINGKTLFEGTIPREGAVIELPLDQVNWDTSLITIELDCETWSPAKDIPDSTDARELALQLGGFQFDMKRADLLRNVSFGDIPQFGVTENGLYDTETYQETTARWTDGEASFSLEFDPDYEPQKLEISLLSMNPAGVPLTVLWNGETLIETEPLTASIVLQADLPSWNKDAPNTLVLKNQPFVPSEQNPESADDRKLGVMIDAIHITGTVHPRK